MSQARIGAAFSNSETIPILDLSDVLITSPADNDLLAYDLASGLWINQTASQAGLDSRYLQRANNLSDLTSASTARTNLGLGTIATQNSNNVAITGGSITGITDLAITDGGTGASTAADARTNLGLVAGGAGDIWVEKAGDAMTGALSITTTNLTTGPLTIVVDQTNGGTSSQFNMQVYTTAQAPAFNFARALNTLAAPQTLTATQRILTMQQSGWNGNGVFQAATQILFEVDGTSGNTLGGRIRMYTALVDGTLTEALRIDDDQRVVLNASTATLTIGTSTPLTTSAVSVATVFDNTSGTRKVFDASTAIFRPTASSSGQLQGFDSTATLDTTAAGFNFTNSIAAAGFQGKVLVQGTGGNVTGARAGNFIVVNDGTGTDIDTVFGIAVLAATNTGVGATMQDVAGLLIVEQTAGAVNNTNLLIGTSTIPTGSFSIYNSSTKDNYFAGDLGIGTTNPTTNFQVSKAGATGSITATSGAVNFTVESAASNANMNFASPAGFQCQMNFRSDDLLRWAFIKSSTAESGANAGSNLNILKRNDAGSSLGNPAITIERATGYVGLNMAEATATAQLHVTGDVKITTDLTVDTNTLFVDASANRVGVGTLLPFDAFDVRGNIYSLKVATNGTIRVARVNGSESSPTAVVSGNNVGQIAFLGTYDTSGSLGTGADFLGTAQANWTSSSNTPMDLAIRVHDGTGLFNRVVIEGTTGVTRITAPTGVTPILGFLRSDTGVAANESLGMLRWRTNDSTVTTEASQVAAYIETTAFAAYTTDAASGIFKIFVMDTTAGGSPLERLMINPNEFVINDTGISHDFRVEGGTQANLLMVDASSDRVGINIAVPTGKLDIDQSSTTGAIPVLQLDQADVSEEFISFLATIGTGNSIEAVGAKTLTTTHFLKMKIQGGLIRYIPCGTIA